MKNNKISVKVKIKNDFIYQYYSHSVYYYVFKK